MQPSPPQCFCRHFRLVPITQHDVIAADANFTYFTLGQRIALLVQNGKVCARNDLAGRLEFASVWPTDCVILRPEQSDYRRCFRLPVCLGKADMGYDFHGLAHHRLRHGRTAVINILQPGQIIFSQARVIHQHVYHGRNQQYIYNFFILYCFQHQRGFKCRHEHVGATHRGSEHGAQAIGDMKHGRSMQIDVLFPHL